MSSISCTRTTLRRAFWLAVFLDFTYKNRCKPYACSWDCDDFGLFVYGGLKRYFHTISQLLMTDKFIVIDDCYLNTLQHSVLFISYIRI